MAKYESIDRGNISPGESAFKDWIGQVIGQVEQFYANTDARKSLYYMVQVSVHTEFLRVPMRG
jgi:hypothetical protein